MGRRATTADVLVGDEVEVGDMLLFAGASAPSKYLLCAGQAVSRVTYKVLFALLGTLYGVGDGSTTFNLPDLRGRQPVGKDNLGGTAANTITDSEADNLGQGSGVEEVGLSETHNPPHEHDQMGHLAAVSPFTRIRFESSSATVDSGETDSSGNGDPHPNVNPWLALNWIIKAEPG